MSAPKQHIILCEGFDDRSFWKGWLLHLKCTDPSKKARRVVDAFGREVKGDGQFLFHTPAGSDVIVRPFRGRSNARRTVEDYLVDKEVQPPRRLLLNLDSDGDDPADASAGDQVRSIAKAVGSRNDSIPYEVGDTLLYPVIWKCSDPETQPGLPPKQTLERLVAASICAAYPDRGPGVEDWLNAEPSGFRLPRSFAHSYYAKWYADHGAGDF